MHWQNVGEMQKGGQKWAGDGTLIKLHSRK